MQCPDHTLPVHSIAHTFSTVSTPSPPTEKQEIHGLSDADAQPPSHDAAARDRKRICFVPNFHS